MHSTKDYSQLFSTLAKISGVICLGVVILGAYVRLSDAGLGCPDWPGCYGQLIGVPDTPTEISAANQNYQRNLDLGKARKEMAHRYMAGGLGLLILALATIALLNRRQPRQALKLPLLILVLVVGQALLGMWTVTWLLMPVVVTAHLAGGMLILSLLWWLILKTSYFEVATKHISQFVLVWVGIGIGLLGLQIILGAWVSANYAALACTDFPTCQQQWIPEMDLKQAFTINRGNHINYEFGTLDNPARVAIHMLHRIGALIVTLVLGISFLLLMWRKHYPSVVRKTAVLGLVLLVVQLALGISNVIFYLPLVVANAHNAVAALLLLAMVTLLYVIKSARRNQTL